MYTNNRVRRGLAAVVVLATTTFGLAVAPSAGAQPPMCLGSVATIIAVPGVPTIGTDGTDVIYGTSGDDIIRGRGGNDLICGRGGDDDVKGNSGDDQIDLGKGDDVAEGGKGNDWIHGRSGKDNLRGNTGSDQVRGGKGQDILRGDKGSDYVHGGSARDTLFGGSGTDQLIGGKGKDDCKGGPGSGDVFTSCNEAHVTIDRLSVFLSDADLGGDWTTMQAPVLAPQTPLPLCNVWVETDLGIPLEGVLSTTNSAAQNAQLGQLVRVHTERSASEFQKRINKLGASDCAWSFRGPQDLADVSNQMIEPLDLTPVGDEFAQAHYEYHVDFDDPGTMDFTARALIIQIRCGPAIARPWFLSSTPVLTAATVDAITAQIHAKLKAAVEAEGLSCADSPS